MLVREYVPGDLQTLQRMHGKQGFDYGFPNISDPLFVSKLVVEDESAGVVMASLARLTCEMYLLMDSDAGTPRERFARLSELHRVGKIDLAKRGLADAHAWLPPPIARRFGRRLQGLGWVRDDRWTPYCRHLD
jgi:hypothetical protein